MLILLTIHLLSELYDKDVIIAAIDPLTAASLVAAIGSVASSLFGHSQNKQMNNKNIQMQRETNMMNYQMNQQNNAFNAAQAVRMFNLENEYNDPKNQMARLKAAGINPFVAAGGSNIGQVEGRADTIPAQQPIPFQAPQYKFDQGIDIGTPMAQLASAIGAIAQAKKNVGDNDRSNAQLDLLLENLRADVDLKNQQILQAQFDNAMNFKYGDERTKYQVENLKAQWAKANQDMNESEARTWLTQTQAMIAEIERESKDAEFKAVLPYLGPMAKAKYENILKEGVVLDTQAASNRASARASDASANASNTQAQLNVSKKKAQDVINKYLPQLSAWQVVAQQYETYGKALVNKKTAQDMVIQARKFLPEIRELFAKGSEIYKNIEYLQGQIDKLPHEIDKIDSETWRNFCSGMKDVMQSADIFTEMVTPF